MKIAILTANLGGFDTPIDPIKQTGTVHDVTFHRFTDTNFPPITGLTPRLQYRIPKLFGWEMFPGYDIYLWYDSSMSLQSPDSVTWFLEQLGGSEMAVFKHPWRHTIKEEVDFIEERLQRGDKYITPRYGNGLHKEMLKIIEEDPEYTDNALYTSTAFIYRNTPAVQDMMASWWYYQSRYFTCDQVQQPYIMKKSDIDYRVINDNQFKIPYISLVSKHK